jgi:DNA mismatch endonuclease (patch repair protein)
VTLLLTNPTLFCADTPIFVLQQLDRSLLALKAACRTIIFFKTYPMDIFTPERRSALMAKVRRSNTRPEVVVRRLLHRLGFRFRLHRIDLPGTPDLVLPKLRTVIFVHGCFWHRHYRCKKATTPSNNADFWRAKFKANKIRDRRKSELLRREGWKVIVIWECETKKANLEQMLLTLLSPT